MGRTSDLEGHGGGREGDESKSVLHVDACFGTVRMQIKRVVNVGSVGKVGRKAKKGF